MTFTKLLRHFLVNFCNSTFGIGTVYCNFEIFFSFYKFDKIKGHSDLNKMKHSYKRFSIRTPNVIDIYKYWSCFGLLNMFIANIFSVLKGSRICIHEAGKYTPMFKQCIVIWKFVCLSFRPRTSFRLFFSHMSVSASFTGPLDGILLNFYWYIFAPPISSSEKKLCEFWITRNSPYLKA